MAIPHEFTAEAIAEASIDAFRPYNDFLQSGEPYVSIYLNNQKKNDKTNLLSSQYFVLHNQIDTVQG